MHFKFSPRSNEHILRLPENIPELIDNIFINDKTYRQLLKFKANKSNPRGYPDVYFDGQTWDFKTSTFANEETLRQTIKDGRKADNIIFLSPLIIPYHLEALNRAIGREIGSRLKDGTWKDLPQIFYFSSNQLITVWTK